MSYTTEERGKPNTLDYRVFFKVPVGKLTSMPALQSINMKSNPLDKGLFAAVRPSLKFELLTTDDE